MFTILWKRSVSSHCNLETTKGECAGEPKSMKRPGQEQIKGRKLARQVLPD